jgi:surface protein
MSTGTTEGLIRIPASVSTIGDYAFAYCLNLKTVAFDHANNNGITFGVGVFEGSTAAIAYDIIGSGVAGANIIWILHRSGLLEVKGTGAMTNYDEFSLTPWISLQASIRTATIAEGITTIGSRAFLRCLALSEVTIPESVTWIGIGAFAMCHSLREITLPSKLVTLGGSALESTSISSITIPDTVTAFGIAAFRGCTNLTSIDLSHLNITSIPTEMFRGCTRLTSITLPNFIKR